jgi:hypothetical protein
MFPDADVIPGAARRLGDGLRPLVFDDRGVGHVEDVTFGYARTQGPVTHGYVPFGNVGVMDQPVDDRWEYCHEPHERLRWARTQWQERQGVAPNAAAAAESLGMAPHTYRAYERAPDASKHTALDLTNAIRFAKKFGVNWQWLAAGDGKPWDKPLNQLESRVIDALREAPKARQTAVADAITQLLKAS